jgi:hypothetical protein
MRSNDEVSFLITPACHRRTSRQRENGLRPALFKTKELRTVINSKSMSMTDLVDASARESVAAPSSRLARGATPTN